MDLSIVCSPPDYAAALDLGILEHQAGRFAAAETAYRGVLDEAPEHAEALHLLGLLACDQGDSRQALRLSDAAIATDPTKAAFHNTRGRALMDLGLLAAAEASFRTAWSLRPGTAQIANNLGCLLRARQNIEEAVDWLRRANRLAPDSAEIVCNLADALAAKGERGDSMTPFHHALRLCPGSADLHYRFANLLISLGRPDEAEAHYRTAIALRPDHAASHNNLGLVQQAQGRTDAAAECFRAALRWDAACADAHYNLGCLLLLDASQNAARVCFEQAIAADPLHGAALWARCMVELPVIYEAEADIPIQRERYRQRLSDLVERAKDPAAARALAAAAGSSQPFFLPYQGLCDRSLQDLYGTLLTQILKPAKPAPLAAPPRPDEPIRVGIVSGWFREHTLWRLMLKGWLSQIDASRFTLFAYHTAAEEDEQTAVARRLCSRFVSGSAQDLRTAILADQPHVLLYPELGMDQVSVRLAAERLAPVQCVCWGQPETSGLPTIDVFLSSTLMEPLDAESHYSEQLVTLPNLGVHYAPEAAIAESLTRSELGLRETATVFWCGQALYKYLPQHDDVWARIAEAVRDCQFLFIGFAKSRSVTRRMQVRLQSAFARRGLDADRFCVFLEPMNQARFLGSVRVADIVLDSIGWSGGKSTLDMLAEAPVIVTHPGPLMRGRHTAAILKRIGVTDTIAPSVDAYVDLAIRLARDPVARARLRVRVAAGRHMAMADTSAIRGLEAFFESAVRSLPTA